MTKIMEYWSNSIAELISGMSYMEFKNQTYFIGLPNPKLNFLNPKSQNSNPKWFDKPFDRLTVLSKVEGLTTLSQVEGQKH
jgi:hypothetical protein